jgi:hypothetical protein
MDTVAINLHEIVRHQVADYHAVTHWKADTFFFADETRHLYVTLDAPHTDHPTNTRPSIIVMARVIEEYVLIDEDITDRPLVKELVSAGIPRDKIICVYNGETIPPHILHHIQQNNPTQRADT